MKINKIGKKYVSVDVHENETGETVWTGVLYIEETVLKAEWFKLQTYESQSPSDPCFKYHSGECEKFVSLLAKVRRIPPGTTVFSHHPWMKNLNISREKNLIRALNITLHQFMCCFFFFNA